MCIFNSYITLDSNSIIILHGPPVIGLICLTSDDPSPSYRGYDKVLIWSSTPQYYCYCTNYELYIRSYQRQFLIHGPSPIHSISSKLLHSQNLSLFQFTQLRFKCRFPDILSFNYPHLVFSIVLTSVPTHPRGTCQCSKSYTGLIPIRNLHGPPRRYLHPKQEWGRRTGPH